MQITDSDQQQPSRALVDQRPMIVVTGPNRKWKFGWWMTKWRLWRIGARGHYLCPGNEELPSQLHGVIIGGGDDIDPTHYGMDGPAAAKYDAARDALELKMIALADEWQLPILGICRGAQLLNVANHGNLLADLRPLRSKTPNRNSLFAIKFASIESGSLLESILQTSRVKVNSLHHQAIDKVGDDLQAVAFDDDQFVQAVEGTGKRFVLGVQWHPEYLPFRAIQTKLFDALKKAALDYAKN